MAFLKNSVAIFRVARIKIGYCFPRVLCSINTNAQPLNHFFVLAGASLGVI